MRYLLMKISVLRYLLSENRYLLWNFGTPLSFAPFPTFQFLLERYVPESIVVVMEIVNLIKHRPGPSVGVKAVLGKSTVGGRIGWQILQWHVICLHMHHCNFLEVSQNWPSKMRSGIVHHKSDRKPCVIPTADHNTLLSFWTNSLCQWQQSTSRDFIIKLSNYRYDTFLTSMSGEDLCPK